MITVNQLIEELIKLRENGHGELPVIYAKDDEGNDYHKVYNPPDIFLVEDLKSWSLEPVFLKDDEEIIPNCVIIN